MTLIIDGIFVGPFKFDTNLIQFIYFYLFIHLTCCHCINNNIIHSTIWLTRSAQGNTLANVPYELNINSCINSIIYATKIYIIL